MSVLEWVLVTVLTVKFILIVITLISPPPFVKKWLSNKFEMHPQLDEETVTVTIKDKQLKEEDKKQIINFFNKAVFLKKYDVIPKSGENVPLVIESKKGQEHISFFLYIYNDRVDVIKRFKRKVIAYYIRSEDLQEHFNAVI